MIAREEDEEEEEEIEKKDGKREKRKMKDRKKDKRINGSEGNIMYPSSIQLGEVG